jgi:hypothetical protein
VLNHPAVLCLVLVQSGFSFPLNDEDVVDNGVTIAEEFIFLCEELGRKTTERMVQRFTRLQEPRRLINGTFLPG